MKWNTPPTERGFKPHGDKHQQGLVFMPKEKKAIGAWEASEPNDCRKALQAEMVCHTDVWEHRKVKGGEMMGLLKLKSQIQRKEVVRGEANADRVQNMPS